MKKFFKTLFKAEPKAPAPSKPRLASPRDLDSLRQALDTTTNADDRRALEVQLGEALGLTGQCPMVSDSLTTWVGAICATTEKSNAHAWLIKLHDENAMTQIALKAKSADTRLFAVKQITDVDRLKSLAGSMRDKDRGVYRHCIAVIKGHEEGIKRTEEIAKLTDDLENLLLLQPLPVKHLFDIRKRASSFGHGEEMAQFLGLLETATRREQDEARCIRLLETLLIQAHQLNAELSTDLTASLAPFEAIKSRLIELPDWLQNDPRFAELTATLARLGALASSLESDRAAAAVCRDFLQTHQANDIDGSVEQAWNALPKPRHEALIAALSQEWAALKPSQPPATVSPPNSKPKAPPRLPFNLEQFLDDLQQLEAAVEAGELQAARNSANRLDDLIKVGQPPRAAHERYRDALTKLGQLRDWARWSGTRARDELIEAAEGLLTIDPDPARFAEDVPKLRAEWRRLDAQGLPSAVQRKRFDAALQQAYQPVLARRAEQSAQAQQVKQAKTAFMAELNSWFESMQWDETQTTEIQNYRAGLRGKWRELGHGNGRDERALNGRFDALMEAIEAKIAPKVAEELDRREKLIYAAERLETAADIGDAVTQAQSLQQRWRDETKPVHIPRKKSDEQWQRFRKAIDAVFSRREIQRAERAAKSKEHQDARRSILMDFEHLLKGTTSLTQVEAELAAFRARWTEAQSTPTENERRPRRDDLDHRAQQLINQAQGIIANQRVAKQKALLDSLAAKDRLAIELETAMAAGNCDETLADRIKRSWSDLPALPGEIERKLAPRLDITRALTAADLDSGTQNRAKALLDLEIFLELASPVELATHRQQRQLALLQQGVRDKKTPAVLLDAVIAWYAISARDDSDHVQRMMVISNRIAELMS